MPNGKVDRAALPPAAVRRRATDVPYVAPRDDTERRLAEIWQDAVGLDGIGVDDDLFDIGGHSLTAVRIAGRIGAEFGVTFSAREILTRRTIADLARSLAATATAGTAPAATATAGNADGLPGIAAGAAGERAPLSMQQEQVWFLSRLDRVVTEIHRRHEILHTTYEETDGRPVQVLHPPQPVAVTRIDLSDLPAAERAARVEKVIADELGRPFDLTRLPLIRWTAIRLAPAEYELVLVEHHLVHDGWSFALLMQDLKALYGAYAKGAEPPLPDPAVRYRDYADWQRAAWGSGALDGQLAYWLDRLADLPAPLTLPYDRPRPGVQSYRGGMLRVELPPALPGALRGFSRSERVTLFTTMYAAFAALLHRYTGTADVCVGSAYANRQSAQTHDLLGMLVNPVVLRCAAAADDTFRALVARAADVVSEAAQHQELPFAALVRALNPDRDPATNPLVQVMFSANDSPLPAMDLGAAVATVFERGNGAAKLDLNVVVVPREEAQVGPDDSVVAEVAHQRVQLLRERLRRQPLHRAAQRQRGELVGTRRPADAQVDAAGVQRLQHAELFGDHQRGVVGQHHAAGPDPHRRRRGGEVRDQHRRGRAGDGGHVVVLGHPEPVVTQLLGTPGQRGRVAQRVTGGGPGGHGREVENGKRHVDHKILQPFPGAHSSAVPRRLP